ncbi:MAG: DUF1289 domain-containing protein [Propionivibrio sp.]
MSTPEVDYPCVGVCIDDPESGVCLGCGRPLDVPPIRPQPPESEPAATTPPDAAQDASTLPRP